MKNAIILQEYELKFMLEDITENLTPDDDFEDVISSKLLDIALENGATHLVITSPNENHLFDLTYKEDIENLFTSRLKI